MKVGRMLFFGSTIGAALGVQVAAASGPLAHLTLPLQIAQHVQDDTLKYIFAVGMLGLGIKTYKV